MTHDAIVAAAVEAGLVGVDDEVRGKEGVFTPPDRNFLRLDHQCGPEGLFTGSPIVIVECLRRRFACPDGREARAYVGRCRRCMRAFFAEAS